jgi:hypothetical protein
MTKDLRLPVAYLAVCGDQKKRNGVNHLVPCGYGVVLISDMGQKRLRGEALFRDTQDCFAAALVDAVNVIARERAEVAGDDLFSSIDFRVLRGGFTAKFAEALDANALGGIAKSGKPYNSYALWNEAMTLKVLSGSTFSLVDGPSDLTLLAAADEIAVRGAEIAAQRLTSFAEAGVFSSDEIDA